MKKYNGSIVALVTPMQPDNAAIDYVKFKELLTWHLDQGTNGIVIGGTTGEGSTLNTTELVKLLEISQEIIKQKIPIIVATGTNCTTTTLKKTQLIEEIGADAVLIVTPYYNKPNQDGLTLHFSTIAAQTELPILLYNVPSRTGCDLIPATVAKLSKIPNIIGIKEATGQLDRVSMLRDSCSNDFLLLSGDDSSFVEFMLLGGNGVISVTANACPAIMQKLCKLIMHQESYNLNFLTNIREIQKNLEQLHRALTIETNPIPIKSLMTYLGKIKEVYRSPLTPLLQKDQAKVINAYLYAVDLTQNFLKDEV